MALLNVDFSGVTVPERHPKARGQKPGFLPSVQQQGFFDWIVNGTGSCIVKAVAGSGKTTTLIHGLELMNGRVYLGCYNKAIALEIQARAPRRDGIFVGTFHSAGFKVWKRAAPNCQVDGKKCHVLYAQQDWPKELTGAVLQLVSLAKQSAYNVISEVDNSYVDPRTFEDLIEHFGIETQGRDLEIIDLAKRLLDISNKQCHLVVDFDDMIYAPLVHKVRPYKHDWVLIDEAQDTNASRRELAFRMLKPNGRLVAVGDPHQAIYGFTGADSDSLNRIAEATGAVDMPLTVSYRCPKAVVAMAQKYVTHIQAAPSAPEGIVRHCSDEDLDKLDVGDVVLCRFNRPLIELAYDLIAQGKPAKVEGRDIGEGLKALARRWKVPNLSRLIGNLENYLTRETTKLTAAQKFSAAAAVEDRVNCLLLLVARVQKRDGGIQDLIADIDSIFGDSERDGGRRIVLCSIHKSKGREWPRVHWLQTGPAYWAKMDWELEQEVNLCYVATTRAQEELVLAPAPQRNPLTKKAKSKKATGGK